MAKLKIQYSSSFSRDIKKIKRKNFDINLLLETIDLIADNTKESINILRTHHNMHTLKGKWKGSYECHVCNFGDWLLIWYAEKDYVLLQRTGSHKDLFR